MGAVLNHIHSMAVRDPHRVALETPHATIRYDRLWQLIEEASDQLDTHAPHAVGIALENSLSWIVMHLACLQARIPQIPIPPFFTSAQITHALRDAGANLLVTREAEGTSTAYSIAGETVYLQQLPSMPVPLPASTAIITYTSGSTGNPKGICLGEQGMEQVAHSLLDMLGASTAQRHLSVLPLPVLLEQIGGLYTSLLAGGCYVIAPVHPADMHGLATTLRDTKAISCILVPELLKGLVLACERGAFTFPQLQFIAVGGAHVAPSLLDRAHAAGLPVYQGYGLTEAASVVAVNTPQHHRSHTVGKILPHIRHSIAADGEIILHTPAMLGTTQGDVVPTDYHTGDLGSVDSDGFVTLHGRKKNILITAHGRNVAPEWPESLLLAQPEIAQAMLYGDGEAMLAALLVPAAPMLTDEQLQAAVRRVNALLPDYARIGSWQRVAPFTINNGMLTGTGRIKRAAILQWISQTKEYSYDVLRPACA